MPRSSFSQSGRPRLVKQTSSQQSNSNRNIRDFFKPFTVPRHRIPINDVVEEEIVVAMSGSTSGSNSGARSTSPLSSPPPTSQLRSDTTRGSTTPIKRRKSPLATRKLPPQLDGADDEDNMLYESTPGSQPRHLEAVEIPRSAERRQPQFVAPPAPTANSNIGARQSAANNISFNSTSSLTSLPVSSQASSSRRIVKDGVPIITNSSSGSGEESEEELQDIVIPRKKMRMTPPPVADTKTPKPVVRESHRISTGSDRRSRGFGRSSTGLASRSPERPAANISALRRLVADKERRDKAEAKIKETEAAFETEQKAREEKMQRERDVQGGLRALAADESDEGERMMLAVERTEAMGGKEEEWFYFKGLREDVEVPEPTASQIAAFVPWAGPQFARLKALVANPVQREQSCLSGFLAQIAGMYGLPPELLDWVHRRLVLEPREEVCEAYVEVFRRCIERRGNDPDVLQEDWASLRALYRTTADRSPVPVKHSPRDDRKRDQGSLPDLRHVLRVVQFACCSAGDAVPDRNFLELALASVDANVAKDTDLKRQLRETMAAVIEAIPVHGIHKLAHTLHVESTKLPLPLRCRIVAALPPHTKRCHKFRRLLALYLVADESLPPPEDPTALLPPNSSQWSTILLTHLRTSRTWRISQSTDYTDLNALIPILDLALDAGFPAGLTTAAPQPTKTPAPTTSAFISPAKPAQSPEEKAFNQQVDTLTDTLRALSARIRDAGTSHLRRTEAKSALERVVVRLEHCVRTRPRPRKGVFSGGDAGRGVMSGFLAKANGGGGGGKALGTGKRERHPDDRVTVVREDQLSDRGGDSDGNAEGGADGDEREGADLF